MNNLKRQHYLELTLEEVMLEPEKTDEEKLREITEKICENIERIKKHKNQ